MKTSIIKLLLLLTFVSLSGCGIKTEEKADNNNNLVDSNNNEELSKNSEIKKIYNTADWPYYDTLEKLTDKATNIYEGRITNIYFEVIDWSNGEIVPETYNEKKDSYKLYTIYEIEVNKRYKNAEEEKLYFKINFGKEGYKENNQVQILKSYDIYKDCLPILNGIPDLQLGKSYLFLTEHISGPYDDILNPEQFAFSKEETFKNQGFTYDDVKEYVSNEITQNKEEKITEDYKVTTTPQETIKQFIATDNNKANEPVNNEITQNKEEKITEDYKVKTTPQETLKQHTDNDELKEPVSNEMTQYKDEKSNGALNNTEETDKSDEIKKSYVYGDWPCYDTLEKLTDKATNIYEGRITNIYFEVIDWSNGEIVPETYNEKKDSYKLYTIYEVEVDKRYKNAEEEKLYFKINFGKEGYKESDQVQILKSYDIYKDCLPILNGIPDLQLGKSYLFLTEHISGPYDVNLNLNQFVFSKEETFKNQIFTYDEVKEYVSNLDKVS